MAGQWLPSAGILLAGKWGCGPWGAHTRPHWLASGTPMAPTSGLAFLIFMSTWLCQLRGS